MDHDASLLTPKTPGTAGPFVPPWRRPPQIPPLIPLPVPYEHLLDATRHILASLLTIEQILTSRGPNNFNGVDRESLSEEWQTIAYRLDCVDDYVHLQHFRAVIDAREAMLFLATQSVATQLGDLEKLAITDLDTAEHLWPVVWRFICSLHLLSWVNRLPAMTEVVRPWR